MFLFIGIAFSCTKQNSNYIDDRRSKTMEFLSKNHLEAKKLNKEGFELHFNCDSVPFLKRRVGDTTKIWTASILSMYEQGELLDEIDKTKFGQTQYINSVDIEGRIELVNMHETTFVHRNDSLFEMSRFIKPKLIFHPGMFSNGKDIIALDERVNYERDKIILGRKWILDGLNTYDIIIANEYDNTEYSYTFDENLRFIYWENCRKRK